jgi:hypothetical protein
MFRKLRTREITATQKKPDVCYIVISRYNDVIPSSEMEQIINDPMEMSQILNPSMCATDLRARASATKEEAVKYFQGQLNKINRPPLLNLLNEGSSNGSYIDRLKDDAYWVLTMNGTNKEINRLIIYKNVIEFRQRVLSVENKNNDRLLIEDREPALQNTL